jgi:hypothetical protein
MATTTFIDNQTVIYAAWLNDVNNAVYNGVFQSSTITAINMVCTGTASGSGFTALVSNVLSAPSSIGSTTPNTGAFTTLNAQSLTLSSTPLAVSSGGLGLNTLTANNVLLGNGTSAVQTIAPGTAKNVLTSNGTTWASTTPIFSKSFVSSNQSIPTATGQLFTVAHGMGVVPKILRLVAVCLTAQYGWTVGAEGDILVNSISNGNIQMMPVLADATNVYYGAGSYILILNFSTGDYAGILNNSNFALKIYAFA